MRAVLARKVKARGTRCVEDIDGGRSSRLRLRRVSLRRAFCGIKSLNHATITEDRDYGITTGRQ
jgi:hypothetical protein